MPQFVGQLCEGPEEILVCIVDDTYGMSSELDEDVRYELFKSRLEADFSHTFEEVDVAPGYSVPAFATLVQLVSEYWPAIVAGFFLAKPVSENLEVWVGVAASIKRYFTRTQIVVGRNAAAALAIEAIFDDMEGIPRTVECVRYFWRDRRFPDEHMETDDCEKIADGPRTEYLSMVLHRFEIRADGVDYEVIVDGKNVSLARR